MTEFGSSLEEILVRKPENYLIRLENLVPIVRLCFKSNLIVFMRLIVCDSLSPIKFEPVSNM